MFIFAGFLGSGKTTALQGSLIRTKTPESGNAVIVCTEEGEEEYRTDELAQRGIYVVSAEEEDELTEDLLKGIADRYRPESVYIEFNGMWDLKAFLAGPLPDGWEIANIFSLVDASTYELYLKNMRQEIMNPLSVSDVILFNRCDEAFKKADVRRALRILNARAEVFFTRQDGSIDPGIDEFILADKDGILEIEDPVFCQWFVDTLDNTDKYYGRKVRFRGQVTGGRELSAGRFYVGRYAVICCPQDAQFIGFVAEYEGSIPQNGAWVEIEAAMEKGEIDGKWAIVLLRVTEIKKVKAPEDKYLYF
ncbi:MAG: hypothetical protein K5697_15565 [Lachnospiraceae bacterium]|nr:hypothetical protein [Lachnospiraceae bacterium]